MFSDISMGSLKSAKNELPERNVNLANHKDRVITKLISCVEISD